MLFILISIAFVTLFERKILALTQRRVGPNKTALKGLIQPLLDGVKLLSKLVITPFYLFWLLWWLAGRIIIFVMLFI